MSVSSTFILDHEAGRLPTRSLSSSVSFCNHVSADQLSGSVPTNPLRFIYTSLRDDHADHCIGSVAPARVGLSLIPKYHNLLAHVHEGGNGPVRLLPYTTRPLRLGISATHVGNALESKLLCTNNHVIACRPVNDGIDVILLDHSDNFVNFDKLLISDGIDPAILLLPSINQVNSVKSPIV